MTKDIFTNLEEILHTHNNKPIDTDLIKIPLSIITINTHIEILELLIPKINKYDRGQIRNQVSKLNKLLSTTDR